jgi:hypothetical protein
MIPDYLATLRQTKRTPTKSAAGKTLNALDALNAPSQDRPAAPTDVTNASEKPDSIERSVSGAQTSNRAKSARSAKSRVPYQVEFDALERKCPALIEPERWKQAVDDGRQFLATWGDQAQALRWTARELFGLHPLPPQPHPSFERLARYDSTGLIWLLHGRSVIGMTADSAVIRTASGGTVRYPKDNKPALGPLGDSLDDMGPVI